MTRRNRLGLVLVAVAAAVVVGFLGLGYWLGRPAPSVAGPPPAFVDETVASGLSFTYDGGFDAAFGGGVAVFDCNADNLPDLYLAGGDNPAALYVNVGRPGGALAFGRQADSVTELTHVNGAYPIDIDSDGIADLVVLRNGEDVVFRGRGNCQFDRANEAWHLVDPLGDKSLTEAFSATWERGQSWPTLAFGNYVDQSVEDVDKWCQPNTLVRPAATGPEAGTGPAVGFGPPIQLEPSWCTLSMLFSDWDGSGRSDLRVSNDSHYYREGGPGQEQLWRIDPGATPRLYTSDEGWRTVHIEGMGIASRDVTGDGLPDVYLTSQAANRLQTLADGPSRPAFEDIGGKYDASVAHPFTGSDMNLPSTAWHPEFDDVNNDGLIDLFVSKGNIDAQPDYAIEDPSNLLLGQPDGTFAEAADKAGIVTFERGRGAALVDLNLDGRLDLVESFYGAPVKVWRNDGPVGSNGGAAVPADAHWLALRLTQPEANVDAIGAIVEVRAGGTTYRRELTIGGGHAGGELGWMHVGLGRATGAEVRVRWPDGEVGQWRPIDVDAFSIVDRAAGEVSRLYPPPS